MEKVPLLRRPPTHESGRRTLVRTVVGLVAVVGASVCVAYVGGAEITSLLRAPGEQSNDSGTLSSSSSSTTETHDDDFFSFKEFCYSYVKRGGETWFFDRLFFDAKAYDFDYNYTWTAPAWMSDDVDGKLLEKLREEAAVEAAASKLHSQAQLRQAKRDDSLRRRLDRFEQRKQPRVAGLSEDDDDDVALSTTTTEEDDRVASSSSETKANAETHSDEAKTSPSSVDDSGNAPPQMMRLEEHFVRDKLSKTDTMREFYVFWRWVLNEECLASMRPVRTSSYAHRSGTALADALRERRVSQGALVFIDVAYYALDRDLAPNVTIEDDDDDDDEEPRRELDVTCVYQHASDLIRRSQLIRLALSYPVPLVLIFTGDIGCRLSAELEAMPTHHALFFAGDGAPPTTASDTSETTRFWLPQGLEMARTVDHFNELISKLSFFSPVATPPLATRTRLFDVRMTVNGRKPSREKLLASLALKGAKDKATITPALDSLIATGARTYSVYAELAPESADALRDDDGSSVVHFGSLSALAEPRRTEDGYVVATYSLSSSSSDEDDDEDHHHSIHSSATVSTIPAVFAIAPAGDVWSSGRVLEALLRNEIPVVDATYKTDDSVSAKGCGDAAAAWRDGDSTLPPAPFLFVEDWADLPNALLTFGASNETELALRLDALHEYRGTFLRAIRDRILNAVDAKRHLPLNASVVSNCRETPLSDDDEKAQARAADAYYHSGGDNKRGSSSSWLESFVDSPALPGAGCTTAYGGRLFGGPRVFGTGALCFSPACAPPQVRAFSCAPSSKDTPAAAPT